jgi:hypothetical protein
MLSSVNDLMAAAPHEPPDARFSPEEFAVYREGYQEALRVVAVTLEAAVRRFDLVEKTKRLSEQKKRTG